ncbi:E3 ubiquitin-protein ligase SlrP [Variovorax sp. WDL1]|nr:E3 ubiquitin-protein ligase SlrP [Variovorax sp. B2]PNG47907.1 E3 ubiquitin-protein ligase SlrP [Variovorax sp. B4]VTV15355.1 E3 ubiquitin-protein ligase SlrP [Variovorax sp. WDL1]
MRANPNRPSPTRPNYVRAERTPSPDTPQDTSLNPTIAEDQNANEDLPLARTGQTEAQRGAPPGDGETSQPASSVHATANDPADPLSAGLSQLNPDLRQFVTGRGLDSSNLLALVRMINAGRQGAPRTEQAQAQGGALAGDGDTSQPASSVPATATDPADPVSARRAQASRFGDWFGLVPWPAPASPIADPQVSLRTGETETQQQDPTSDPEGLSDPDYDDSLDGLCGGDSEGYSLPTAFEDSSHELPPLPFSSSQYPSAIRERSEHLGASIQRFSPPSAAAGPLQRPATAGNPTIALSKALDLDQGFCESPEWQRLAQTQDLSLLANLVARSLQTTKNPNLKRMLLQLVEDMAARPTLAERVFVVLQWGDDSCGDRVSHALYMAQGEQLVQPVWDGALNQDVPKVVDIARQVFRRRAIYQLAQQKVKDINNERRAANRPEHTEEIETHLAYLAGLHESLELGGEKPDAMYTDSIISGVTPEDIEAAKRAVLTQEGEQFWEFLATWKPWQEVVLRARFPDEVTRIEKAISDPDRPARLQGEATTEVDNANVPPKLRQEAITLTANQRGKDEALQLWLALTRKARSNRED